MDGFPRDRPADGQRACIDESLCGPGGISSDFV